MCELIYKTGSLKCEIGNVDCQKTKYNRNRDGLSTEYMVYGLYDIMGNRKIIDIRGKENGEGFRW